MLFAKRSPIQNQSSGPEACISILGLFLAIGILGGLSALIYGLIKGNISGIVGGAIVLGASVFFSVILALVFVCCLKSNNVNSTGHELQSSSNQHRHRSNQQISHERTSKREVTAVLEAHRFEQPPQSNGNYASTFSPTTYNNGLLADSSYSVYTMQMPQSPSRINPFVYPNPNSGYNQGHHSHSQRNSHENPAQF